MTIEIDTRLPCFSPRLSAQERADEAVELLAHDLISLTDAVKAGAAIGTNKRAALLAIARRIGDLT